MKKFKTNLAFNRPMDELRGIWDRSPFMRFFVEADGKEVSFDCEAFYRPVVTRFSSVRKDGNSFAEYHGSFLNWFDRFQADWVFFDIGANIGVYSLIAARWAGVSVFAFEPEVNNARHLVNAVHASKILGKVTVLPFAVGSRTALVRLSSPRGYPGVSDVVFGSADQTQLPQFVQQVVPDELVAGGTIPQPNAMKIDVDGPDLDVLRGAAGILENPALKTVCIELNQDAGECLKILTDLGFRRDADFDDGINAFLFR